MLDQLRCEATHRERGQFVEFISSCSVIWCEYVWNPYLCCGCRYNIFHIVSLCVASQLSWLSIAPVSRRSRVWFFVEALIFFRLLPSNCLNWKIYCDDHSSLSSLICKQFISELETSETVCLDSNLLFDTSLVDVPYTIFDTSTCAVSVTKSCSISFYAFCFSVLIKLVVFGTLIH